MKKRRIVFRADGGSSIGMGHIVRSLALAEMLKDEFDIAFAVQQPVKSALAAIKKVTNWIIVLDSTSDYSVDSLNFSKYLNLNDIVVLDGYNFKTDYQKKIKARCARLVCIDDLHECHQLADVIINHAGGIDKSVYDAEPYTKFCLGFNYALLRKSFLKVKTTEKEITGIRRAFISMGAGDTNNLTQKYAEALLEIKGIAEIHLLLSSINPHLEKIEELISKNSTKRVFRYFDISAEELCILLKKCDIAICPASTISLECCAVGIGLVSGFTANNQLGILDGLRKNNVLVDFGDMNLLTKDKINRKFEELSNQAEMFNAQISNQRKMIDGKSPKRLLDIFRELMNAKIHFRFAETFDVDLYFKWANDPLVRMNSFNRDPIKYEDHVKWFQSKLASNDCRFYLFLNEENVPVGQVRIDKNDETIIGVTVDEKFRGQSLSVQMLKMACKDYLERHSDITIIAYIKMENIASFNAFKKAGFNGEEIVMKDGEKVYKLHEQAIE